ncbi:MAG TPA: hypothetical protein ENI23_01340 [bacterium]|nr:hypothetical protein [bacterium]
MHYDKPTPKDNSELSSLTPPHGDVLSAISNRITSSTDPRLPDQCRFTLNGKLEIFSDGARREFGKSRLQQDENITLIQGRTQDDRQIIVILTTVSAGDEDRSNDIDLNAYREDRNGDLVTSASVTSNVDAEMRFLAKEMKSIDLVTTNANPQGQWQSWIGV